MNRLSLAKRCTVVAALVEGNSVRSTCRLTGVAKGTVLRLLADVGRACSAYQDWKLRDLPCKRLQCDEIWSFCHAKEKNVPAEKKGEFGYGDVWTWTAICAETKLVPCWLVGLREAEDAKQFIVDLSRRLTQRIQPTTDGYRCYLEAVESGFGGEIDYAMLVKLYGSEGSRKDPETRYSPGKCNGTKTHVIAGNPDPEHISTSYVERQNLTMRMGMRRFTRLTNAFSKKLANLEHAVALHFMHYNFARRHQTLRVTPAMAAGVTSELWNIERIVRLAD
jgi:IS1 family transposase